MQLKKFLLFGLMATILPAMAEEAADRKTATSLKYVEHELDTRQNKFTAESNKAMEYTNTAGIVQQRTVKSDLGTNTSDTSLPMVGGVNTKLATKQDDIAPINDHTAVTYTGQSGSIGQKGIYQDTGTYADQSDNLIDAKTFNAALKKGLDSEFKCREDNRDPDTDLCWLYTIHNTADNGLPDGYTELEYIEIKNSSTNAYGYINSGIVSQPGVSVNIKVSFDGYTGAEQSFFGTRHSEPFMLNTANSSPMKIRTVSVNGDDWYLGSNVYPNTLYDISMDSNAGTVTLNGVVTISGMPAITTVGTDNLFVGAAKGHPSQKFEGKIYGCDIKLGNAKVREFVPAKNSSNVIGMYDLVSGNFFTNAGTGDFIAGPEINTNNIYIPQNQ